MRSSGREDSGGSVRVFVRPVVMLALGALAGIVMWRVLMADDGRRPGFGRPASTLVPAARALRDPR